MDVKKTSSNVDTDLDVNDNAQNDEPRPWTFGLFGCLEDCGLFFKTIFCYPCVAGDIADRVGESYWLYFLYNIFDYLFSGYALRSKIRQNLDIEGSGTSDFCIVLFCPICATIQEHRELTASGIGPGGQKITAPAPVQMARE